MIVFDKIVKLFRQLLPSGRAFRMPKNGDLDKMVSGISLSKETLINDSKSVIDSIFPDNDNFTEQDATDAERRYGLINSSASLSDRKASIIRKIRHPGDIKARQHYLYIQEQLQEAGFNVFIHENIFVSGDTGEYITETVESFSGVTLNQFQLADFQLGDIQMGTKIEPKVVNYIEELPDSVFNVGDSLRATFFIGGAYAGDFADVELSRKDEFRQMILRLKPVQCVGYLLINYI